MYTTRATLEHAKELAKDLRDADALEVHLSSRMTPEQALVSSVCKCEHAWSLIVEGRVRAIFGVGPTAYGEHVGCPWMLRMDDLGISLREFYRLSKQWVYQMSQFYPVLVNMCHVDNEASIRWLRHLGFSFSEPMTIEHNDGLDEGQFVFFKKEESDVHLH